MADQLICPVCKNTEQRLGISVYRDTKATRHCNECGSTWLPENDDPESGGPYVINKEETRTDHLYLNEEEPDTYLGWYTGPNDPIPWWGDDIY